MRNAVSILLFLTLLSISIFGEKHTIASLLVSNCKPTEGICHDQELYRYDFADGNYVGKELIIASKTDDLRFDLGVHQTYRNRYVITSGGDVIDVRKKKILHKSDGELFRIEGDSVYVVMSNDKAHGLFVYDLLTGKYSLVRKTNSLMSFGELSPNAIRSAWWHCPVGKGCGIEIIEFGGIKNFIEGKFEAQVEKDESSSEFLKVPVLWLDDERILTQSENGKLVIVNINGKITPLLNIEIDGLPGGNPRIFRDEDGRIIYSCVEDHVIDVEKGSYKINLSESKFDFEFAAIVDSLKKFYLARNEPGEFALGERREIKDHYAILYTEKGGNLGSPKGVKVFSNINKKWTTIDIQWGPHIIGWIEG